ncbi:Conserved oligomeric Golgi complex subunit 4 [Penicillium concentricum]|uniref:Conserved oligomeric Golgi complex subunit 4 n=1 Tax=Penicillium concentricum TaxID=293559 RepID=A0A9W9VAV1_9EURO|nr:Conserved oligomeric Golgi complex subunit 4 [Penicillium concentricum]KAJ5375177.1 Conserved oligomeric Golgi complex subunit 4 [Penicillium concentricum]
MAPRMAASANGHNSMPQSPPNTNASPTETSPPQQPDIFNASSVAEIKATLSHLHTQEASVTARLDALVTSQKDLSRELGRLDLMRANIGTHASTTRSISHGMLSEAAGTADRISSAVRRLDLEQARVKATLEVVEQVAELKACALGVAGSMGASQDWEKAASYLHRAAQIPVTVVNGAFAADMVPTAEVPDPPSVTLDNAAESLCGLFLREFEKAVKENDGAKITRFFKLFPLIGRSEVGLDVYGRYVCQGVAAKARANLNGAAGGAQTKDGFFYANALTKLFEHIAQIIDGHGGLVEHHYGPHKMGRVIERLQVEADVQGGIILDTWSDERHVDRKLMDIKSYAFTFLVQSFLPAQRPGPPRSQSPTMGASTAADEEGVDMKEIDGVLNEMAIMLGRWSLYCRFLADTCNSSSEGDAEDDKRFELPRFVQESPLAQKINDRLVAPFNAMTTFFFRRSVEKAFQLDESPSGLTLNPQRPLKADPPHITSAVDDIMYIVNKVIQQSLATSQETVVTNVVPTLSRVLGSDFIGMTQRKMRDECYPRAIQGGQPAEQTTISFLVQINNLDLGVDYIRRIVQNNTGSKTPLPADTTSTQATPHLLAIFANPTTAQKVHQTLQTLSTTFESKVTDLLTDGIQVIFNNAIKPRLRPILADTFRDIEYAPNPNTESDNPNFDSKELVKPRFTSLWNDLLTPYARILTPSAFDRILGVTIAYLARLLEKRLWSYGARINALGAARLERDVAGLVGAAVDVGYVSGAPGRYRYRECFARCVQMTLVMGMDEDEWDEVRRGGVAAEVVEKLGREDLIRVRGIVRR